MKKIKNIFIVFFVLFGLFFNNQIVSASNNLDVSFVGNDKELLVTVKNNSDKELTDIEYDLHLPNNLKAEYLENPKYDLYPSEGTSFKLSIESVGVKDVESKEANKSYSTNKNKISNTGLSSEAYVGISVFLLLLVFALIYFKHKKALVVFVIATLGTQFIPNYTFASEKYRVSEYFEDNVTLLNADAKVSLDISYLVEKNSNGDISLKNEKNDGDTKSNNILDLGDNKEDNKKTDDQTLLNVNEDSNNPKEVLVAGYAYSGKDNLAIKNKELKVFDGDKEVSTVKTDSEGYFFTHIVQNKTYTIKGEDFEVTVTAKNSGDYEYENIIGKLSIGRVLEDEHTNIKIKPSVAFINEDIEYKVEGNTVTIDGEYIIKEGDKLILSPSRNYLTGFAFYVKSSLIDSGMTILTVEPIKDISLIVDDFKYKEEVDISRMELIPAEGVEILKNNTRENNGERASWEVSLSDTFVVDHIAISASGKIKFDFDIMNKKAIVEPEIEFGLEGELSKNLINVEDKKIATLAYFTYMGIETPIELYVSIDGNGNVNLKLEIKNSISLKLGYDNEWIFEPDTSSEFTISANVSGEVGIGPKFIIPATIFKSVDILSVGFKAGPSFEGNFGGGIKYKENKLEKFLTGEAEINLKIKAEAEVSFIKGASLSKEFKISLGHIEKDYLNSDDSVNESSKIEYTGEQLALIGRLLQTGKLPEIEYLSKGFSMWEKNNSYYTSLGVSSSDIKVDRINDEVVISIIDYSKPAGQRDFKEDKKYSIKDLKNKVSKEQMDYINKIIEEYKKLKNTNVNKNEKKVISSPDAKYNKVFEDLKAIDENKVDKSRLLNMMDKLNVPIHTWTIEGLAENIDGLQYSFYDVDKDGLNELLLAITYSGNKFSPVVYYLESGNPKKLVESFIGGSGGARHVSEIYNNGDIVVKSWSSGTGIGTAELYGFNKGSMILKKNVEMQNAYQFNVEALGVSKKQLLDLNSLNWQSVKK